MIARSIFHINKEATIIRDVTSNGSKGLERKTLRSKYSLVSTGTERLVSRGEVPKEMYVHMKVPHMHGDFNFPISYGYSLVASDNECAYHLMHPHQDLVEVNPEELFQLKEKVPTYRSPLISNMETVLNAIWDADLHDSDQIAICGFGNIGSLLALSLKLHFDKEVSIIETDQWRSLKAEELGFIVDKESAKYDVIFHSSATQSGLQYCIDHLNEEGRVVELSWYGDKRINLELGKDFHYKRLRIISSQVSKIPKKFGAEMTYLKRKQIAARMLEEENYDKLISDFIDFEKAPIFYNDLRKGGLNKGLIWMIKY